MALLIVRRSLLGLRGGVVRRSQRAASPSPSGSRAILACGHITQSRYFSRPSRRSKEDPSTDSKRPSGEPLNESRPNADLAATLRDSDTSDLVSEVSIPHDPHGVLPEDHPAMSILGNSGLVIQRQIEMMNILVGFEQANKYIIMNGEGETVGYIAEQDHGLGRSIARQMARTHRSFTTYIFNRHQQEVLRIHRPFTFINSKIRIYDAVPDFGKEDPSPEVGVTDHTVVENGRVSPLQLSQMRIIGECQSQWTALRRKYNLFSYRTSSHESATTGSTSDKAIEAHMQQFSMIDEPLLAWDFTVKTEDGQVLGNVNRTFRGFAREIFTDTGVYVLRLDAAAKTSALEDADGREVARYENPGLTLDQRAVMIATAVSIDFDYFSRHSGHSPGFMPFIPIGGGGAAAGEAAAGAGVAGAAEETGMGVAGAAGRAIPTGAAGAGTVAGYEAMQQGAYGDQAADFADPTYGQAGSPFDQSQGDSPIGQAPSEAGSDDVWGSGQDPWQDSGSGAGDGGEEGGGGIISWIIDIFTGH